MVRAIMMAAARILMNTVSPSGVIVIVISFSFLYVLTLLYHRFFVFCKDFLIGFLCWKVFSFTV